METPYFQAIRTHYLECWPSVLDTVKFDRGPINELPGDFRILRFAPRADRTMWTYATQCMSQANDSSPIELHLFATEKHPDLVELLVATAHYHRTGNRLGLGHTVNFGRPWLPGSQCDHGLVSLPYLDGPSLEWQRYENGKIRFLWLIPITIEEVKFARRHGLVALESRFQKRKLDYLDPARASVV